MMSQIFEAYRKAQLGKTPEPVRERLAQWVLDFESGRPEWYLLERGTTLLRSVSQNTNVKIRDLAATIVTRASGEPPQPTAPFEDG